MKILKLMVGYGLDSSNENIFRGCTLCIVFEAHVKLRVVLPLIGGTIGLKLDNVYVHVFALAIVFVQFS